MATIWGMQIFSEPYLMTEGGPLDSSQTVTLYLYEQGFIWSRLGYASAIGVTTAIIILAITLIQRRVVEREVGF
jgi:multiple sugar transport system permease protein